jgi:hypothetical protein
MKEAHSGNVSEILQTNVPSTVCLHVIEDPAKRERGDAAAHRGSSDPFDCAVLDKSESKRHAKQFRM